MQQPADDQDDLIDAAFHLALEKQVKDVHVASAWCTEGMRVVALKVRFDPAAVAAAAAAAGWTRGRDGDQGPHQPAAPHSPLRPSLPTAPTRTPDLQPQQEGEKGREEGHAGHCSQGGSPAGGRATHPRHEP